MLMFATVVESMNGVISVFPSKTVTELFVSVDDVTADMLDGGDGWQHVMHATMIQKMDVDAHDVFFDLPPKIRRVSLVKNASMLLIVCVSVNAFLELVKLMDQVLKLLSSKGARTLTTRINSRTEVSGDKFG